MIGRLSVNGGLVLRDLFLERALAHSVIESFGSVGEVD